MDLRQKKTTRPRVLALAVAAACLLAPAAAQAVTPTIVNQSSTSGKTNWLESFATAGETGNNANQLRISVVVKHDPGLKVTGLKIDDDWDGTEGSAGKTAKSITLQQPSIVNGYDYSRVTYSYALPTSGTGMSCGLGFTRRTTKDISIRAVLSDSSQTDASKGKIDFTAAGQCAAVEDFPYLYSWAQTATSIAPGDAVTFTFKGDDPDASGNADFTGVNWRMRRLSDGATTTAQKVCYPSPWDNAEKKLTPTFPSRGRWVVEAELLNNADCNTNDNAGAWFWIGAVDVNTAAAASPTLTVAATRPQIGGSSTVSATFADGSDSGQGGRVQDLEWDLDENTTNGVAGFEAATLGDVTAGLTSPQSKTVSTAGQTPGLHTVRVRATDNGAMSGADSSRSQKITTATYLVDTPPVATGAAVRGQTGAAITVPLNGTDIDGDTLTASIVTPPTHGALTGSGLTRTYTSDVGYVGVDTFTYKVDDGYGGTDIGTATVHVAPDARITSAPAAVAGTRATVGFDSSIAGATFECRLDGGTWDGCVSPVVIDGLAAGSHALDVRASAGGETDPTPAIATWTQYPVAPDTTLTGVPAAVGNDASPSLTFTSPAPGATFECSFDGADFAACTSPASLADLADGGHTFMVRAVDPVDQRDPTPAAYAFTVDTVAPTVTVTAGPPAASASAAATFAFTSTEPSTFECRLDGGAWGACPALGSYTGLLDGAHTFDVRGTDAAGNVSTAAHHAWAVDTVAPVVGIASGPPARTSAVGATIAIDVDDASAALSCRLDGGAWAVCTDPVVLTGLADGDHVLTVRATDGVGNVSNEATHSWTVDTTPPAITVSAGPPAFAATADATFAYVTDEPATLECRLDGGAWATCTSPHAYTGLADGQHTADVRATDALGNVSAVVPRTWTVDTTKPVVSITGHPAALVATDEATFAFTADEAHVTFECSLDGGPWAGCASADVRTALADGAHTHAVRATDRAGNVSEVVTSAWRVDTTAPVVTITGGPTGTVQANAAEIPFSAAEPATFECRVDGGAWAACASPFTASALADGDHVLSVRATDTAGNRSAEAQRSWRVEHIAPIATVSGGPTGTVGAASATLTLATDQPNATLQCRLDSNDGAAWTACTSPLVLTGLADGPHTLQVRAVGPVSGEGAVVVRHWTVDTIAPAVVITAGPQGTVGTRSATFTYAVDDARAAVECRIDGAAWDDCASPATYTGLADGEHVWDVRARDAAGNVGAASRTWAVDGTRSVATISSGPAAGSVTRDRDATFAFRADQPSATFECRLDGGAWAACASPADLTALADGEHTLSVRAITAAGLSGPIAARTWEVRTTASPLEVVQGPSGTTASSSVAISFATGGGEAECRLNGAAWLPCATPQRFAGLRDGAYALDIRVTDGAGNTSETTHRWAVDTTAPNATVSGGPDGPTSVTDAMFAFTADEGGATFRCQVDEADYAACTAPFAARGLAPGDHTFRVRAVDAAGNVGPVVARSWSITPPSTETTTTVTTPPPAQPKGEPVITGVAKVTVKRTTSRAIVAKVRCPDSTCTIRVGAVTFKVQGKRYKVALSGTGAIAESGTVQMLFPKAVRSALRGRSVTVKVQVTARSSNGVRVVRTLSVHLVGAAR